MLMIMILIKPVKWSICKSTHTGNVEIYWCLPGLTSHRPVRLRYPPRH
jgi:hypothetical protein